MPIKVEINAAKVQVRVEGAFQNGMEMLATEILQDCNEFAKEDTGTLILSSWIHSQLPKGTLVWATPYARRQFYEIRTAYKDKNPNASWRWALKAKAKYKERWNKLAQKALRDNL